MGKRRKVTAPSHTSMMLGEVTWNRGRGRGGGRVGGRGGGRVRVWVRVRV